MANKMGDDDLLMSQHAQLHDDDLHDALSLAALYYVQGSFEKAADIFKKLLVSTPHALTRAPPASHL